MRLGNWGRMNLDVQTLFLLTIPLAAVFGLLHAACWLRWRDRASLWWMAADGSGAGALVLVLLRWLPAWVTFVLGPTVIVVSGLLLWLGFRCMARQSLPLRKFTVASLAFFVLYGVLRSLVGDQGFLFVLSYLVLGTVNAGIAVDLTRASAPGRRFACRILAVMFLLHALFYLFRGATSFLVKPVVAVLDMTGLQSVTVLVALFTVSSWNLGALWLTAQQRQGPVGARVDV